MGDASSVRKSTSLPSPSLTSESGIRYTSKEVNYSTGTQWTPLGRVVVTLKTADLPSAGAAAVFIADRALQLLSVKESHAVVSTAANLLTVKKAADGVAASAGTDMLAAGLDLKAAVDTVQSATLSATAANTKIAAGERLCVATSASTAGLAGAVVVLTFRAV